MENQKNVPELRFPEFEGEWEKKKLGEVARFSKGKGISKADITADGLTECIRYGELYTYYREAINTIKSKTNLEHKYLVFSEANDVIIPASGETQIDIATASCVLKSGVALGGDLNIIKTENNGLFLSYYLNSKRKMDIANLAQGISVVHLYSSQLSLLNLNLPTLPEQSKIATFLTAVDDKLQALKKKKSLLEVYKKGVMQKLFSQELRFRSEDGKEFGDWEEKKLGEVCDRITTKNKENNTNVLTISAQIGLISQLEFFNKSVSAKNVTGYYLLHNNDFAYNKSYSNGYPMGAIKRLKRYVKGVVSTLYICFRFNDSINLDFMEQYFEMGLQNVEIEKVAQEGARNHGLLNIGVSDFLNIGLILPSHSEQTLIANFLSSLDEKINHTQTEITKTEVWKKGLLQKMFV